MDIFERDLNVKSVFAGSEYLLPQANPKIYIRSKWKPCAWDISLALKLCLQTFCKALEPKFRLCLIHQNILPHQLRTIGFIKKKPKWMVVQTDYGLDPVAIYPKEYFQLAIKNYLGDTRTYQRLTPAATAYRATLVQKLLDKWIKTYLDLISKEERKCIRTNLRSNKEPQGFSYLLFKVQKGFAKDTPCRVLLREPTVPHWVRPV